MRVGEVITLWNLAKLDGQVSAHMTEIPTEVLSWLTSVNQIVGENCRIGQERQALMMRFEGLGDNCEFGLVQRHFGAEPLGLLRWASNISPFRLANALQSRFDGVGQPENTSMKIMGTEYMLSDNRYFDSHTFITQDANQEDLLRTKMVKRMVFLREKLIRDLDEGDKIFVYKPNKVDLPVDEGLVIANTMLKSFPNCKLMLLRIAPSPVQVSTVERVSGNVVWGFLSRFAINLDHRFILFSEWLALCEAAAVHFGIHSDGA